MNPYIYIKIEASIHTHKRQVNKYLITLEQDDNEWIWNVQDKYETNQTQQSLKDYIDHITQRKYATIKNIAHYITRQKNKYINKIIKHWIDIYIFHQNTKIHIGRCYISNNNILLHTTTYNNQKHSYNINALITKTPKELQYYLQQHIPINDIINYHHNFPNQHERGKNILFHYHPHISMHIPCAISVVNIPQEKYIRIVDHMAYTIHNTSCHETLNLFLLPRINNTKNDANITINIEDIPNIYNITNPTDQSTQHIKHIKQYLHEIFIPSPLFQQSSHHDQIRMLRAIQQHGDTIAQDIYTTANAHLQHRQQVITLTLPKVNKTRTKFLRNILAWISKT